MLALALAAGPSVQAQQSAEDMAEAVSPPQTSSAEQERDQGLITTFIEDKLSGVTREVRIQGFEGALSSEATIARLAVSDAEGEWLVMEDLVLQWTRAALLRGRVDVEKLGARRIAILRKPIAENTAPSAEAEPLSFKLPELPVSIEISELAADVIELGPDFLGEPVSAQVFGDVTLKRGALDTTVNAVRTDDKNGRFLVRIALDETNGELGLNLIADEAGDGIAARLLDLPGRPSVWLEIEGQDPLTDFTANVTLETDEQPRLTGAVRLTADEAGEDGEDGVSGPRRRIEADLGGDISPLFTASYRDFFGDDVRLRLAGEAGAGGGIVLEDFRLSAQAMRLAGSLAIGPDGWPRAFDVSGYVASPSGDAVLVPTSGPRTQVQAIDLAITYDAAKGPRWSADMNVIDFTRPGVRLPLTQLTGGGDIVPPGAGGPGRWTLGIDYITDGIGVSDAGLAQALGDRIAGRIEARGAEGAPTEIPLITLTGPGVEARGTATVQGAQAGYETRADLRLDAARIERFSGLAGRDLAGAAGVDIGLTARPEAADYALTVTGETRDLALGLGDFDALLRGEGVVDIALERDATGTRLPRFEIHTDTARIDAEGEVGSDKTEALVIAQILDAAVLSPDLAGEARITATAHRDEAGVTQVDLAANLPGATARIAAAIADAANDNATTYDGSVRITDLARYSDLTGRDLNGSADGTIKGQLLPDSGALTVALTASTRDLAIGDDVIDALLQGRGALTLDGARDAAGALTLRAFDLETDELTASGTGRYDAGSAEADFDARLRDASVLSPDLSGPMRLTGTAAQDADGNTRADISATGPGAEIDIAATVAPVSDDPATSLATRYDITANLDDLSRYAKLTGRPLRGSAQARISGSAAPRGQAFDAMVDAEMQDLALGIPAADALLVGAGHLRARAARSLEGEILLQNLDFATPRASAQGDARFLRGQVGADLRARIENVAHLAPGLPGPAELALVSTPAEDGRTRIELRGTGPSSSLTGTMFVDQDDPALPADYTLNADLPRLSAFREVLNLRVAGAVNLRVQGQSRITERTGSAQVSASVSGLETGQPVANAVLAGRGQVSGTVARRPDGVLAANDVSAVFPNLTLRGDGTLAPDGSIAGDFGASLSNMALLTPQLSGSLRLSGTASRTGAGETALDVDASGAGGLQARAQGTIAPNGRMRVKLTGAAPLALANRALAPRSLRGMADFDLALNGQPGLEALSGVVRVQGARLSLPSLGEALGGIDGALRLQGQRLAVDLRGAVARGGTLAATGTVGLDAGLQADLSLTAEGLTLKDPTLYETTVDGQARITGPLARGARIAGLLELDRTEIRVPSSGVGTLGELPEVRHVGVPAPVARTLERAGLSLAGLDLRRGGDSTSGTGARAEIAHELDLTVRAPSRIFIRGRGLDAELGGRVHIGGTTLDTIPSGRFDLIRGRIDILQQRFDLTEGFAALEGDFTPYIRLVATTGTTDGTASIVIEGEADAPEIHFESTPDLPEDEVLSRLIFGRDLSSISPLQAVQLAAAVNTLAGRGSGGLMGQLRDSVGLDDLDVTSDDDGTTAVRAGKYLSENIYSDVTVRSDGTSRIDLNLDVTDDVTVRGGASSDGVSSVGVFFERDY